MTDEILSWSCQGPTPYAATSPMPVTTPYPTTATWNTALQPSTVPTVRVTTAISSYWAYRLSVIHCKTGRNGPLIFFCFPKALFQRTSIYIIYEKCRRASVILLLHYCMPLTCLWSGACLRLKATTMQKIQCTEIASKYYFSATPYTLEWMQIQDIEAVTCQRRK